MKASMYARYPARSLLRGGQRTLLALFCVAVGVMAIVGLQLVGNMVKDALVGNARALNGGDLSVRALTTPLSQDDLAVFDDLRRQGLITTTTAAVEEDAQVTLPGGRRANVQFRAVDPAAFPLVGDPALARTSGGDFAALLGAPGNAVVSRALFDRLGGELGRTATVTVNSSGGGNRQFEVTIAGVLDESDTLGQGEALFVSTETYRRASPLPFGFSAAYAVAPDPAGAARAKDLINDRLPLARVQTAGELLDQLEDQVVLINRFLTIVGLLALLIGGIGIVNTMQVLLARRRVEIAMLKTAGYQRRDLYGLFGLEAALLGLLGGAIGALVGIGVAAGIRALFERAFRLALPFTLDPGIILGGVAVGLATALIFGLLPIVQAAGVRPTAVLRELPEGRSWGSVAGALGLVLLLSVLFAALASVIIGDWRWGLAAVYGAFLALGLLSIGFGLLVFLISKLPVPERYSLPYLALVTLGVLIAAALFFVPSLRGISILLLIPTLIGYLIVLLPRTWKISTKMAFRNLGRARGRSTTTLLALFIGVFAVGLVLVLGQGVRATVNTFIANQIRYNVIALVPLPQTPEFERAVAGLDGVKGRVANTVALGTVPLAINGELIAPRLGQSDEFGPDRISSQVAVIYLSGVQGYDLAGGAPREGENFAELTAGRALTAADAGTNNVLLDNDLRKLPLQLNVGDRITVANQFTGQRETLDVVGFYKSSGTGISINTNVSAVLGSQALAQRLGGPATQTAFYLDVDSAKTGAVTEALTAAVPRAQVVNLGDILDQFGQVLNNLLLMLISIASLALLAGIIIIANAVALAMLERRRELGIMKSVGYTSGRVLGVVLIENGIIGAVGGLLGMLLVALATFLFSVFGDADIAVGTLTTIGLVLFVALVAMLTAALVAWGATRVRPLEVLRYE